MADWKLRLEESSMRPVMKLDLPDPIVLAGVELVFGHTSTRTCQHAVEIIWCSLYFQDQLIVCLHANTVFPAIMSRRLTAGQAVSLPRLQVRGSVIASWIAANQGHSIAANATNTSAVPPAVRIHPQIGKMWCFECIMPENEHEPGCRNGPDSSLSKAPTLRPPPPVPPSYYWAEIHQNSPPQHDKRYGYWQER